MNPQPDLESESLRSDINTTRDRMDNTLDALGNRLEGRHLVDELLGFFRGRASDMSRIRDQVSRTAGTAVSSVVDTVKAHPVPVLMAGAGIAWLIYETTTDRSGRNAGGSEWTDDVSDAGERGFSTTDSGDYEVIGEGESAGYQLREAKEKSSSMAQQAEEKLSDLGDQARDKASQLAGQTRQTLQSARERVGEMAGQVQQRSRELYGRTRERVVATADQHPLEVGLGFLAVGLLVAMALPTPDVVNRRVGPAVDRLKDRTRAAGAEAVEKGKRVVQAAASAAQQEARKQGLALNTDREGGAGERSQPGSQDVQPQSGSQPQQTGAPGSAANTPAGSRGPSEARTAS